MLGAEDSRTQCRWQLGYSDTAEPVTRRPFFIPERIDQSKMRETYLELELEVAMVVSRLHCQRLVCRCRRRTQGS
jgi:hypothetical protein